MDHLYERGALKWANLIKGQCEGLDAMLDHLNLKALFSDSII